MDNRMQAELPKGLKGWHPNVVYAKRHPAGPWLVIQQHYANPAVQFRVFWLKRAQFTARVYEICLAKDWGEAVRFAVPMFQAGPPDYALVSRSGGARDYQRKRVYKWEDSLLQWELSARMTLDECRRVVLHLWHADGFRNTPPDVTDGRGRRSACASRFNIELPVFSRCLEIVCHETAHAMAHCLWPSERITHGPKFVGVYIRLLGRHTEWVRETLIRSAQEAGVDVDLTEARKGAERDSTMDKIYTRRNNTARAARAAGCKEFEIIPVPGGFTWKPKAKAAKAKVAKSADGLPRPGTKNRALVDMLLRKGGTTMSEMLKATGWKKCSGTMVTLCAKHGLHLRRFKSADGTTRWEATQGKAA